MAEELEFPNGLMVKAPRDGAPDYVKGAISIKTADLMAWLQGKYEAGQEWVNLDVKESRGGKWYCAVNTYKKEGAAKPQSKPSAAAGKAADLDGDQIPF